MKKLVKEYGLVALLIFIGVGGYLALGTEKEDLLASSLDALGQRLISMVDDQDAKTKTSASFEEFRSRIAANEIAPEEVERIAANVLNLTTSGTKLTPEEAEMVLSLSTESEILSLPTPSRSGTGEESPVTSKTAGPQPEAIARAWNSNSADKIGERISSMVIVSDKVREMSQSGAEDVAMGVQYIVDNGLKVVVDSISQTVFSIPELATVAADLEDEHSIIWEKNLRQARRKHIEELRTQRKRLEDARSTHPTLAPQDTDRIKAMERLNKLQEAGVILQIDSTLYDLQLKHILDKTMKDLEIELQNIQIESESDQNLEQDSFS